MKPSLPVLLWLSCALAGLSCRERGAEEKLISGPPNPGAYYSLNDGEGGYRLAQVLTVEPDVTFVRLFRDRWPHRPTPAEAGQATKPVPVAYRPDSFTSMRPVHVQNGAVAAEDLSSFEEWKKGAREAY